jgi:hypothetical protein
MNGKNIQCVRYVAAFLLVELLSALLTVAEPKTGMLCVIPNPPGCCQYGGVPFDPTSLMFRIDNGKKTPWPEKTGVRIDGMKLEEKHLVVVYSGGKPIQSFRFRFADYHKTDLCLLFDGYGGPDLRPMSKICHCS